MQLHQNLVILGAKGQIQMKMSLILTNSGIVGEKGIRSDMGILTIVFVIELHSMYLTCKFCAAFFSILVINSSQRLILWQR